MYQTTNQCLQIPRNTSRGEGMVLCLQTEQHMQPKIWQLKSRNKEGTAQHCIEKNSFLVRSMGVILQSFDLMLHTPRHRKHRLQALRGNVAICVESLHLIVTTHSLWLRNMMLKAVTEASGDNSVISRGIQV